MSDEELTAHQKLVEEQKAKAQEFATRASRPMELDVQKRVLGHLTSTSESVVLAELTELQSNSRREIFKEDVQLVVQLGLLLTSKNEKIQGLAYKLWLKWGTAVEKHASDEDKARVGEIVKQYEEMAGNPFEEEGSDDGKGVRTWSDKTGKFKVEGEFQEMKGNVVVLKGKDGKIVRIPKARLSEDDQKLIDKLAK